MTGKQTKDMPCASRGEAALKEWAARWKGAFGTAAYDRACAGFPYAEVLADLTADGKLRAPKSLFTALDEHDLSVDWSAARVPGHTWLLHRWLESALDQFRGRLLHDTYTSLRLLVEFCSAGDFRARSDQLIRTLLADLLCHEARMEQMAPRPQDRTDVLSTRVAALVRAVQDTPDGGSPIGVQEALEIGESVLARCPEEYRRIAELTPIRVTPEPDEYLFIRMIQTMELVFTQAARVTTAMDDDLRAGRVSPVAAGLRDMAGQLQFSARLFRVMATISTEQFETIRMETVGTSALQSKAYAQVERHYRGTEALREESVSAVPTEAVPLPGTPLTPRLEALAGGAEPALRAELAQARQALDQAWTQWKRTHWAVARRTIGDVPGTGETSGVSYLRGHMNTPLTTPASASCPASGHTRG